MAAPVNLENLLASTDRVLQNREQLLSSISEEDTIEIIREMEEVEPSNPLFEKLRDSNNLVRLTNFGSNTIHYIQDSCGEFFEGKPRRGP